MNFYIGSPRLFEEHYQNEATPYEVSLFKPITDDYHSYGFIGDRVMELYMQGNYGNMRKKLYESVQNEYSNVYDPENYMSWLILFLSNNDPMRKADEYRLCAENACKFAPPDKKEDVKNLVLAVLNEDIEDTVKYATKKNEDFSEFVSFNMNIVSSIEKL